MNWGITILLLAKHSTMQRVARNFEEEEARLKRFAEFFENNSGTDKVLDFWAWDATMNPKKLTSLAID